jgi:hypothetical protein
MPKAVKAFLAAAILSATVAAAFYLGGVLGYAQGVGTALGRYAPSDAVDRVHVLQLLRRGDAEEAIRMLEILLDTDVLKHVVVTSSTPSPFRLDTTADSGACLMRHVAKYRAAHPSVSPDARARATVTEYLGRLHEPTTTAEARRLTRWDEKASLLNAVP